MCCPVRAAQSQNVFAPFRGRTPLQRVQKVSKIKGLASVVQDLCRNNTQILESGGGGCPARRADLRNVTSPTPELIGANFENVRKEKMGSWIPNYPQL